MSHVALSFASFERAAFLPTDGKRIWGSLAQFLRPIERGAFRSASEAALIRPFERPAFGLP